MISSFTIPGTLVSIHMRFPMNTYQSEGITSPIWDFFQIAIPLLAHVANF